MNLERRKRSMKDKIALETAVGLFVVIGLICIGYLTVRLGKLEIIGGDYYAVSARFSSVAGLKKGAQVEMAGVRIGQVEQILLDKEIKVAVVTMKIQADVPISQDAIASVKTSGLIGDKYITIEPGGSPDTIENGGWITETESAVDMEELISKYAFGEV